MNYVLDTDILSLLGHDDSPEASRIRRRIAEIPANNPIVTTVINYEEQMRGWMAALAKTTSPKSEIEIYDRLLRHLATFRRMTVLQYDDGAGAIFGRLRKHRLSVGTMDLKIASIVLACDGTLVTRNASDFRKIEGLRIEHWTTD